MVGKPYEVLGHPEPGRVEDAVEKAIVLGAGAAAVALASERDPTVAHWWIARIEGAVEIENRRWGGGDK